MKKLFFLASLAFVFAACSDSDDGEPNGPIVEPDGSEVVDFESADLGSQGFLWGKDKAVKGTANETDYTGWTISSKLFMGTVYSEKLAQVQTYYTDYGGKTDVWMGFVISGMTDRTTEGYTNDKSVYAESGADGSKQFAVAYSTTLDDKNNTPRNKEVVQIIFRSPVEIKSVDIANATYPYLYYQKAAVKPNFEVVISGFRGVDREPIDLKVQLTANGKMIEGWKTVDLSSLGKIARIQFKANTSDAMLPTYFCIDNLKYERK